MNVSSTELEDCNNRNSHYMAPAQGGLQLLGRCVRAVRVCIACCNVRSALFNAISTQWHRPWFLLGARTQSPDLNLGHCRIGTLQIFAAFHTLLLSSCQWFARSASLIPGMLEVSQAVAQGTSARRLAFAAPCYPSTHIPTTVPCFGWFQEGPKSVKA